MVCETNPLGVRPVNLKTLSFGKRFYDGIGDCYLDKGS